MPYIAQNRREQLDVGNIKPSTPGDLTYLLTRAMLDRRTTQNCKNAMSSAIAAYMNEREIRFGLLAEVLGALTATRYEYSRRSINRADSLTRLVDIDEYTRDFYRRVVAPYEDQKIVDNGDVY